MSTIQKSESINNLIKKQINYNYDLLCFLHHFQKLVDDRRYEELKSDFKATQSIHLVEILKHA